MTHYNIVSRTLLVFVRIMLWGSMVLGSAANAMDFTLEKRFGKTLVVGDGPIIPGDSDRLQALVDNAQPQPHGYRVLEVNSPGGDVEAALRLADVIHDFDFHVVVPPGRICASACGSVLFLAGKLRTVREGGELSLHTCDGRDTQWPAEQCNKAVEDHALSRGLAHGPLFAYMRAVPARDMIWFGRSEAECAGLTRYFMEETDHFGPIGPCFASEIAGKEPDPVLRWRIDMRQGGYYAFIRSFSDYDRLAQTEIYCKASDPGHMFVSAVFPEIEKGPASVFKKMSIELDDRILSTTSPRVHMNEGMRTFTARFPDSETLPLLTQYEHLIVGLEFLNSENPVFFGGRLRGGRKALIFAANHCEQ